MPQYPRRYNRDVINALLVEYPEGEDRLLKICQEYEAETGDRLERAPLLDLIRRGAVGEDAIEERPARRYPVAAVIESLLYEDPWLILHPKDFYQAYRKKVPVPCAEYTFRRWVRQNGLAAAQLSPHYEDELLEEIPPHRRKGMTIPQGRRLQGEEKEKTR